MQFQQKYIYIFCLSDSSGPDPFVKEIYGGGPDPLVKESCGGGIDPFVKELYGSGPDPFVKKVYGSLCPDTDVFWLICSHIYLPGCLVITRKLCACRLTQFQSGCYRCLKAKFRTTLNRDINFFN